MSAHWPKEAPASGLSSHLLDIKSANTTVFVRNLSYEVDRPELQAFFEAIAPVKNAFVVKEKHTDTSRGFGFVEFATEEDAKMVVKNYHGFKWLDRELRIDLALQNQNDPKARLEATKKHLLEEKKKKQQDEREEKRKIRAEREAKRKQEEQLKADEERKKQEEHEKHEGNIVIICGLDENVTTEEITNKCRKHGQVLDVIHPSPETEPPIGDKPADIAARITFASSKNANAAVKALNNKPFGPKHSKARVFSLSITASKRIARLVVRNLNFNATPEDIREVFSKYGRVLDVNIPKSATGHTRGFAFVQMNNYQAAKDCVDNLNGELILNRKFTVDFSLPKDKYDFIAKQTALMAEASKKNEDHGVTASNKGTGDDDADAEKEDGSEDSSSDGIGGADDGEHEFKIDPNNDADADADADDDDQEGELVFTGDYDEDDEDEDDDDDEDDHDANNSGKSTSSRRSDANEGCTIFIRNLSYDTDDNALHNKFSSFGRVKLAIIVRDKVLHRSMGTAFVQFHDRDIADEVIKKYSGNTTQNYDRRKNGRGSTVDPNTTIRLDGRDLIITRAVDRNQASKFEEEKKPMKRDRRRLYLAKEGVILPNTPAAEGVSKLDMDRRERGWNEKKKRLQNPNFSVSDTRLSVRNIPFTMNEKELRTLVYSTVVKANKAAGKKAGDIKIKQVKIERDPKKFDQHGLPRSKGFGFVEFADHEHSLTCLRELNNNPKIFTASSRPIVEFALDDARKVLMHKRRRDRQVTLVEKSQDVRRSAEQQAMAELLNDKSSEPVSVSSSSSSKKGDSALETIFKKPNKFDKKDRKRSRPSDKGEKSFDKSKKQRH